MTEPQVWAALGVLLAFLTATLTVVTRTISVQVGGLRHEMNARFDAVHDKFDARFDRVQDQITTLDRDVQALTARVFRDDLP